MDRLPIEILQSIFTLASADGDSTWYSLSLTSRYIRAASRACRFHTITLVASPRRLQSFVALYERECDPALGDRPYIQHLHVTFPRIGGRKEPYSRSHSRSTDRGRKDCETGRRTKTYYERREDFVNPWSWSHDSDGSSDVSSLSDRELTPHAITEDILLDDPEMHMRGREPPPDSTSSPEYRNAARTLFRLVAPSLQTLVIQCGFSFGGGLDLPVFQDPFVALRELTLVDVQFVDSLFVHPTTGPPIFPAATHLHLLFESVYYRAMRVPTWALQAPRVTHFRVTGATLRCRSKLALAVGVEPERNPRVTSHEPIAPPPRSPSPTRPPTYPSVRHLVILPCPMLPPPYCPSRIPQIEHAELVDALERMTRSFQRVGLQAVIIKPLRARRRQTSARELGRRAHEEWLERIAGGAGCWASLEA